MIISSKKDLNNSVLNINGVESIMEPSVKLLDIEIDSKLKFEKQISNICKKARKQLNAIFRLPIFMGHKEKESMINIVVYSDVNYGCLIWHFCSKKSYNKVKKNYERSLNILLNGYLSSYTELFQKPTSISMESKRLYRMVYKIFKTLNNLNPVFMKHIFHYSPNVTHRKHNLYIHT